MLGYKDEAHTYEKVADRRRNETLDEPETGGWLYTKEVIGGQRGRMNFQGQNGYVDWLSARGLGAGCQ